MLRATVLLPLLAVPGASAFSRRGAQRLAPAGAVDDRFIHPLAYEWAVADYDDDDGMVSAASVSEAAAARTRSLGEPVRPLNMSAAEAALAVEQAQPLLVFPGATSTLPAHAPPQSASAATHLPSHPPPGSTRRSAASMEMTAMRRGSP